VNAIIYDKKLEELKPSQILSKIMTHELKIMPKSKKVLQEKPQESSCPTTSHVVSGQQENEMRRLASHVREEDLQVCEQNQHVRLQRPLERRASPSTHQVYQDQAQDQEEGCQGEEAKARSNCRRP
jgi:hypothetical protein